MGQGRERKTHDGEIAKGKASERALPLLPGKEGRTEMVSTGCGTGGEPGEESERFRLAKGKYMTDKGTDVQGRFDIEGDSLGGNGGNGKPGAGTSMVSAYTMTDRGHGTAAEKERERNVEGESVTDVDWKTKERASHT